VAGWVLDKIRRRPPRAHLLSQSDAEGTVAGRRRQSRLRRVWNLFRKCYLVQTETNQVAS